MVFLLPPCKLTRLVEQAVKWVQGVEFGQDAAVSASDYGTETSCDRKFRPNRHLENLRDAFVIVGAPYPKRVLCDCFEL